MRNIKWILVTLFLIFTSCTTTTGPNVNLNLYQQRPEDMQIVDEKPPKYIIEKKTPRIAILQLSDHSGLTKMESCQLGPMATDVLHNVIANTGRYQVVERAQAKKLAKELGYQETHGVDWENIENRYSSLGKDIDYVIVGAVNRVTAKVDKNPQLRTCTEEVETSVALRIVDLRNSKTISAFEVKDKAKNVKSITQTCIIDCGLIQKALENTLNRWVPVKLEESIPLYGYISKIMSYKKDGKLMRIAYINLGKTDGLKPGDKVIIMELRKETDPISGKQKIRYIDLGKATVSQNGLMPDEAIIIIDDQKLAACLKIGMVVQTTAERAKKIAQQQQLQENLANFFQMLSK